MLASLCGYWASDVSIVILRVRVGVLYYQRKYENCLSVCAKSMEELWKYQFWCSVALAVDFHECQSAVCWYIEIWSVECMFVKIKPHNRMLGVSISATAKGS